MPVQNGPELGVVRRGLVEAHLVHTRLQVVGVHAEQRHAPLPVVEARRPGDELQDAASKGAAHRTVAEHERLAGLELQRVPVVIGRSAAWTSDRSRTPACPGGGSSGYSRACFISSGMPWAYSETSVSET